MTEAEIRADERQKVTRMLRTTAVMVKETNPLACNLLSIIADGLVEMDAKIAAQGKDAATS